jgi:hypothetical protein
MIQAPRCGSLAGGLGRDQSQSVFRLIASIQMQVQLNKQQFNSRLKIIYDGWTVSQFMSTLGCVALSIPSPQNTKKNDECSAIADVNALLLLAGDPAGEDEPIRKGTSFQVISSIILPPRRFRPHLWTDLVTRIRIPFHLDSFPKG